MRAISSFKQERLAVLPNFYNCGLPIPFLCFVVLDTNLSSQGQVLNFSGVCVLVSNVLYVSSASRSIIEVNWGRISMDQQFLASQSVKK